MEHRDSEVLVVGAGLAGLAAAQALQAAGHQVIVVDKGSSVGGRLATCRVGDGAADHGAQYFSARTDEFQRQIDQWEKEGLVFLWAMGSSMGSLAANEPAGHPRYAVHGGMYQLAKHLARDLTVELNVHIRALNREDDQWVAEAEDGTRYRSQSLILTPPVPLIMALLDSSGIELNAADRRALEAIEYTPCIVGIFRYEGEVRIPQPGAVQRPANAIPWIADNQQKGISPNDKVLTLESSPDYSRRYWDAPEVEIVETMQGHIQPYLTETSRMVEAQIKRWRYSAPATSYPERTLVAVKLPPLIFAGDGFGQAGFVGQAGVEGAYLSGLAAAQALDSAISKQ